MQPGASYFTSSFPDNLKIVQIEHPVNGNAQKLIVMKCRKTAEMIREELTQSDSVLIPESTLQSFLGASSTDLSLEASQLANENGWTATRTPDSHWLFERKVW